MEVKDLMKPRYKVIAGYPVSVFVIGEVIKLVDGYYTDILDNRWSKAVFDNYPNIFKPLAWWEEREESDMPEYIRPLGDKVIIKPDKWFLVGGDMRWHTEKPWMTKSAETCEPATESEYLTQSPAKAGE